MAMTDRPIKCRRCDGRRWVCEIHPFTPWDGPTKCGCGAAGDPCPDCNPADELSPPVVPPDFEIDRESDYGYDTHC